MRMRPKKNQAATETDRASLPELHKRKKKTRQKQYKTRRSTFFNYDISQNLTGNAAINATFSNIVS